MHRAGEAGFRAGELLYHRPQCRKARASRVEGRGRGGLFRLVRGKPLPEWADDFDATTWAQFFLKFLISHEAVNAVIPGTENAVHMIDNLGAGRGRLPDAAMLKRMAEFVEKLG